MERKHVPISAMYGRIFIISFIFILGTLIDVVMLRTIGFAVGGLGAILACITSIAFALRTTKRRKSWALWKEMLRIQMPVFPKWHDLLLCIAVFASIIGVTLSQPIAWSAISTGLLLYALSAALIPPFLEELMNRGFLQTSLEWLGCRPWFVIIFTAIIFSLSHFPVNTGSIPISLVFGLIAGYIVHRTKSVYVPFIAHGLWNFVVTLS